MLVKKDGSSSRSEHVCSGSACLGYISGGSRGLAFLAPPSSLISFIFMQCFAKIRPNNRLASSPCGRRPPTRKSWIRHWTWPAHNWILLFQRYHKFRDESGKFWIFLWDVQSLNGDKLAMLTRFILINLQHVTGLVPVKLSKYHIYLRAPLKKVVHSLTE